MNLKLYKYKNKGISPAIGVALLVAITVALVVLASVIVLNIEDGTETNSAEASIDFTQTSSGINVQVVSNTNVDEFKILFPDGTETILSGNVGSSLNIVGPEGRYSVVAIMHDDTEQVLISRNITGLDYGGIFIVSQDTEEGEVYARLASKYDNIDDYNLNLEAQNNEDEDVLLNSNYPIFNNYLVSNGLVSNTDSNSTKKRVFKLISISVFSDSINSEEDIAAIGETIAIHDMVNLFVKETD
jgi:flagellin-like protein